MLMTLTTDTTTLIIETRTSVMIFDALQDWKQESTWMTETSQISAITNRNTFIQKNFFERIIFNNNNHVLVLDKFWEDSDKSTGLVEGKILLNAGHMDFFYKWVMLTNFTLIRLQFSGKKRKSVFFLHLADIFVQEWFWSHECWEVTRRTVASVKPDHQPPVLF